MGAVDSWLIFSERYTLTPIILVALDTYFTSRVILLYYNVGEYLQEIPIVEIYRGICVAYP